MTVDKTTLKVLNKLFDNGYTTEKSITSFSLEDMRNVGLHSKEELDKMLELIEAVKKNKVIMFLAGEKPAEQE